MQDIAGIQPKMTFINLVHQIPSGLLQRSEAL